MSGLLDEVLPDPPPNALGDGPGLFGDAPAGPASAAPYRVLARKYRPTRFEDLIGQDAMVRTLRNAFSMGRVAHAWMLTGVRGVGKTTTARILARALNCTGPDGNGGPTADPCGTCPNCVAILADRHPDVVEMDAASRTGVDDVREIIDAARYRPLQARTKVFIVDEVHMLSRNAFNALLKTLEEPPPHVKFVFATTEIRKVPVTVLSRCQRFDLRRVPLADLAALFGRIAETEGARVAPGALELIARAADGSARDGLSLLDQAIAQGANGPDDGAEVAADAVADMLGLADRGMVFDLIEACLGGRPADALALSAQAHERGADPGLVLGDLLELAHTLTRLKVVPALRDSPELPEAERVRGAALSDRLSIPVLGRAWQMLLRGVQEVEQAADRRAAAEMVLIRLCYVADLPPPGELVRRIQGDVAALHPVQPAPTGRTAGATALAEAAPAIPAPAPSGPVLASFRDVVALVAHRGELVLAGMLRHAVHLVRFAPPVIELRPEPSAPRDLAARLAALLHEASGVRWTIALSHAPGEPTLAEQEAATGAARLEEAARHPLVRAILDAFPGARLGPAEEEAVPAVPPAMAEPDLPEFAPLDAEPADAEPVDLEEDEP